MTHNEQKAVLANALFAVFATAYTLGHGVKSCSESLA